MITKVILYGYSKKVYSSRGIENLLSENVLAKWIAAAQELTHRTINRFRSEQLKNMEDSLFEERIKLIIQQYNITMETTFWMGLKLKQKPISFHLYGKNNEQFRGKAERKKARYDSSDSSNSGI